MIKPSIISWPISKKKHIATHFLMILQERNIFQALLWRFLCFYVSNGMEWFVFWENCNAFLCFKGPKILYGKIAEAEAFARWRMENLHEKAVGKQSINKKPLEDLIFSIFILDTLILWNYIDAYFFCLFMLSEIS